MITTRRPEGFYVETPGVFSFHFIYPLFFHLWRCSWGLTGPLVKRWTPLYCTHHRPIVYASAPCRFGGLLLSLWVSPSGRLVLWVVLDRVCGLRDIGVRVWVCECDLSTGVGLPCGFGIWVMGVFLVPRRRVLCFYSMGITYPGKVTYKWGLLPFYLDFGSVSERTICFMAIVVVQRANMVTARNRHNKTNTNKKTSRKT